MSSTYTQVFGGQTLPSSGPSFSSFSLSVDTQFYWPELAIGDYIVADIMEVSSTSAIKVIFPDASLVSVGRNILIRNTGAFQLDITDFLGATITTIATGVSKYIYLKDNSSASGIWENITFGAGTSSADAASLKGAGLTAIGSTLNTVYPTVSQSGTVTLDSSALGKTNVFSNSGAISCNLPHAATAGDGFFTLLSNQGGGSVTVAPYTTETIDGESSKALVPGESMFLVSNGALWVTVGYGRSTQFQFTKLVFDISSGTPFTLTSAQAQNKILNFVGTITAPVIVNVPAVVAIYYVQNTYSGAYSLTVKTASGTGVVLGGSDLTILYCDGTNVVNAQTVSAPASNLAGGSAGVIPFQSATNTTSFTASGSTGQVLNSHGSGTPTFDDLGVITHTYSSKSALVAADELMIGDSAASYAAKRTTVENIRSYVSTTFRNRIINGAMRIDQRQGGNPLTITAGADLAFVVDRFYAYCNGANVVGQQITTSTGAKRYRFTGASSNVSVGIGQRILSDFCSDMAGKTATLQVKLSSTSLTSVAWALYYANTTNTFGTLASPAKTLISNGSFSISSTEATYSATVSIPSGAYTGLDLVFATGALASGQTLTIGDVQLAQEAVASSFENTPQFDTFLSMLFYTQLSGSMWQGYNTAGSYIYNRIILPVRMRQTPQASLLPGSWTNVNCLTPAASAVSSNQVALTSSPTVTGYAYSFFTLVADAELWS